MMNGNGQSPTSSTAVAKPLASTTLLPERTPANMALDNLIRRRLKVSDPASPTEIASALERAYPAEVAKLGREQMGLPFSTVPFADMASRAPTLRTDADAVRDALERDLRALDASSLLNEIQPELRGWASGIRSTFQRGLGAARQGIDPQQRETTFACRRTLAEYARLVRFAGALTPRGSELYRQLARSIDAASGVMLVELGAALDTAGQINTRFLLQAPIAGLQLRRDAVLQALRALLGVGGDGAAPDGWPRGVLARRQLGTYLQANGYGDLESLLEESYLARQLDALVEAASTDDQDGMRSVSSAAEPTLNALQRLVLVCQGAAFPQSPTLEAFRVALQHFIDPFHPQLASVGYRIPFIARAPLLIGRISGLGGLDAGTTRLVELARLRLELADEIDNYLQYAYANDPRVLEQVWLDACLQCVDSAIDLYALGADPGGNGPAEWRAAAYAFLAYEVVRFLTAADVRAVNAGNALLHLCETLVYWGPLPFVDPRFPVPPGAPIANWNVLAAAPPAPPPMVPTLPPPGPPAIPQLLNQVQQSMIEELTLQGAAEERWFNAARAIAPTFVLWARPAPLAPASPLLPLIQIAAGVIGLVGPMPQQQFVPDVPRDVATLLEVVI